MGGTSRTGVHIASAFLLILLAACEEHNNPPPVDIPFVTSDGHFKIGGHYITVPMIALRGSDHVFTLSRERPAKSRKEILKEQASDPRNPMPVERLALLIHQYEMRDQHGASREICPPLTRHWAQVVCRGQHKGVLGRLPEKFDLLDRTALDQRKRRYAGDGKQERIESLRSDVAEIGCENGSEFCAVAVEPLPGLFAVWTVWSRKEETMAQMAERQGPAIVEFVRKGIGPIEDKTLATAD